MAIKQPDESIKARPLSGPLSQSGLDSGLVQSGTPRLLNTFNAPARGEVPVLEVPASVMDIPPDIPEADRSPIPGMTLVDWKELVRQAEEGDVDPEIIPDAFKKFASNLENTQEKKSEKEFWRLMIELASHRALQEQNERVQALIRDHQDVIDKLLEEIRKAEERISQRNLRLADIRDQLMDAGDDLADYKKNGRFRRDANGNLDLKDGTKRLLEEARRRGINPNDDAALARLLQEYLNPATSPYTPEIKQLTDANKKDEQMIDRMKDAYDRVEAEAEDLVRIHKQIMDSNLSDEEKRQKLEELINSRQSVDALEMARKLLAEVNANDDYSQGLFYNRLNNIRDDLAEKKSNNQDDLNKYSRQEQHDEPSTPNLHAGSKPSALNF